MLDVSAAASEMSPFRGREKQDVFLAAPMDGFTAAPERAHLDRGCALYAAFIVIPNS